MEPSVDGARGGHCGGRYVESAIRSLSRVLPPFDLAVFSPIINLTDWGREQATTNNPRLALFLVADHILFRPQNCFIF